MGNTRHNKFVIVISGFSESENDIGNDISSISNDILGISNQKNIHTTCLTIDFHRQSTFIYVI